MESNYKIYPYQLYKEKDGIITVTVNDKKEPPKLFAFQDNIRAEALIKIHQQTYNTWKSNCLIFKIDAQEAYEIKDNIRSYKHLGKLAGQDWVETIQKGVEVNCIAIVDGKAIFHNPNNNEENINQPLLTIDEILIKNGITNLTAKMHDQFIASINEYYVIHSSEYKIEISKLKQEVDKWMGIAYVDGVNSDLKSEKIDSLTKELQEYKDIYESRSLKSHYENIKGKNFSLSKIYGFKEPYDANNWIHNIRNKITWSDFETVTKWLFEKGYDIIKPK